jgi:hypothetical protein
LAIFFGWACFSARFVVINASGAGAADSERADASHILADDQRMDIVRAFIGFY